MASSGLWISELFPHVAECADELCLIRSMRNDHPDHFQATLGIHTGSVTFARPSIGAWVSYGLGTVNRNLPSFVVLAPQLPYAADKFGPRTFCPAVIKELPSLREQNRSPTSNGDRPPQACRNSSSAWPNRSIVAISPNVSVTPFVGTH